MGNTFAKISAVSLALMWSAAQFAVNAQAYSTFPCRWPNGSGKESFPTFVGPISSHVNAASNAKAAWNSAQSFVGLTTASSGASSKIWLGSGNYGNVFYVGIATFSYSCIGATFAGSVTANASTCMR
jgi:hypothetical protein